MFFWRGVHESDREGAGEDDHEAMAEHLSGFPLPVYQFTPPQLQVAALRDQRLPQPYPWLPIQILIYRDDRCIRDNGPSFVRLEGRAEMNTMGRLLRIPQHAPC
jgi:hypothetical protein